MENHYSAGHLSPAIVNGRRGILYGGFNPVAPDQDAAAGSARRGTPGIGDPVEALSLIYTDTILHDVRVLKFVVEMMGTERLMMGSDMPFPIGDFEPTKIVATAGLPKAQADSINGGLAVRLFRIAS